MIEGIAEWVNRAASISDYGGFTTSQQGSRALLIMPVILIGRVVV